ncbi:uncharacterized protein LOC144141982 [Haemaphysalis longicornis]
MKAWCSYFDNSRALVVMLLVPAILGSLVLMALRFPVTGSSGAAVVPVSLLDLPFGWYQDTKKCSAPTEDWYVVYKTSPDVEFGGTDGRCVRYTTQEVSPESHTINFRVRYLPDGDIRSTVRYKSRLGESYFTLMENLDENGNVLRKYQVLFSDCLNCKIVASLSPNNDTECVLYAPGTALSKPILHCHFVYDLFCGATRKLPVSDEKCLQDALPHE